MYHSSRRKSCCWRDHGGGNLLLTVLSETDHSGSKM